MGLKFKLYRLLVKLRRSKPKNLDLDDVQQRAYDIALQMISDKKSNLMYDPIKGRKAIQNKEIFVELKKNKIVVINGVYHYEVPIDDRIYEHVSAKFNDKMARKFNVVESTVLSKVKNSLDVIKKDIFDSKENVSPENSSNIQDSKEKSAETNTQIPTEKS